MSRREIQRKSQDSKTRRKSKSIQRDRKKLNKEAMVTTIVFSIIFVFMICYYAHFVVVDSRKILNNPYNKRIDSNSSKVVRDTIYSKSGKKLAYTDTKGTDEDYLTIQENIRMERLLHSPLV